MVARRVLELTIGFIFEGSFNELSVLLFLEGVFLVWVVVFVSAQRSVCLIAKIY